MAVPTRKRTRTQDRAYRVQWERGLNRARYAADHNPSSSQALQRALGR